MPKTVPPADRPSRPLLARLRSAAGRAARGVGRALSPTQRRWRRELREADRAIDAALGVQTGGLIDLVDLTPLGPNAADGHPYAGTIPDEFDRLLALEPFDPSGFTFVDLGSGMGRAVLLAAKRPFARCIGVEFAAELHDRAVKNLETVDARALACRDIEFVHADALAYELPAGPLCVYLYNPFNDRMQRRLVDRLVEAGRAESREILIYQCNARWPEVWDGAEGLEAVAADGARTVHRVRSAAAQAPLNASRAG